jgi:anti-sigma factor RsiW
VSLPHQTILQLMSLADGELRGDEKAQVERLVEENDEAREIVEAMRRAEVGAWLGEAMTSRAGAAGADGIADAVMAKVGAAPVVAFSSGRARRASRWRASVTAAAATLALAAGVAAYMRSGASRTDDRATVASAVVPPAESPLTAVAQQARAMGGVEVNEIDAPSHGVSVFEIPAAAAAAVASPSRASSVVVWVEDDAGPR